VNHDAVRPAEVHANGLLGLRVGGHEHARALSGIGDAYAALGDSSRAAGFHRRAVALYHNLVASDTAEVSTSRCRC
jgi:hypothetical protein